MKSTNQLIGALDSIEKVLKPRPKPNTSIADYTSWAFGDPQKVVKRVKEIIEKYPDMDPNMRKGFESVIENRQNMIDSRLILTVKKAVNDIQPGYFHDDPIQGIPAPPDKKTVIKHCRAFLHSYILPEKAIKHIKKTIKHLRRGESC